MPDDVLPATETAPIATRPWTGATVRKPGSVDDSPDHGWWSGRRLLALSDDELATLAREQPRILRVAFAQRKRVLP